jgi:hypothetical protein
MAMTGELRCCYEKCRARAENQVIAARRGWRVWYTARKWRALCSVHALPPKRPGTNVRQLTLTER